MGLDKIIPKKLRYSDWPKPISGYDSAYITGFNEAVNKMINNLKKHETKRNKIWQSQTQIQSN